MGYDLLHSLYPIWYTYNHLLNLLGSQTLLVLIHFLRETSTWREILIPTYVERDSYAKLNHFISVKFLMFHCGTSLNKFCCTKTTPMVIAVPGVVVWGQNDTCPMFSCWAHSSLPAIPLSPGPFRDRTSQLPTCHWSMDGWVQRVCVWGCACYEGNILFKELNDFRNKNCKNM